MDHCNTTTPEEDVAIAQRAFADGDFHHAMHHLAGAVAADPMRPDWLALVDKVLDAAGPDPLRLTPIQGPKPPFTGTVAIHAYTLARLGRHEDAIGLILQVCLVAPGSRFIEWPLAWLRLPHVRKKLGLLRVSWFLTEAIRQLPMLNHPDSGGKALLARIPELIRTCRETQAEDPSFLSICVSVYRRIGMLDDALECAQTGYALEANYQTAVARAMAHRDRQEIEQTLTAYQDALQFAPDDVAVRLDLGDMMWDLQRIDESMQWYEEALKLEPNQPWALPSLCFLRWATKGDESQRQKLMGMADFYPDNQRARDLADQASPWIGFLPEPTDATTNGLRQLHRQSGSLDGARTIKLTLSCLEPPSNYLSAPGLQEANIQVVQMHTPDPRLPRQPVKWVLWQYDGIKPTPALEPPSAEVAEAVADLAKRPFHLFGWWHQANRVASVLKVGGIPELLATMVHPPPAPQTISPWGWVYRVQVAAALCIARTEIEWAGSDRRAALHSLIHGPLDWTIDAAILALTALALDDQETIEEIRSWLRDLHQHRHLGGAVCYVGPLLWCSLRLPGWESDERSALKAELKSWLEPEESEAETQYKLARIHEKNGELDKAYEAVTKALTLAPEYLAARALRAWLGMDLQRLDDAITDFTLLLQYAPNDADTILGRGEAHAMAGNLDEAESDCAAAARLAPANWRAHYWLGCVHRMKSMYKESVDDYSRAAECEGVPAIVFHFRGKSRILLAQFEEAVADQTKALELSPSFKAALLDRSLLFKILGRIEAALADLDEAIRVEPSDFDLYNRRAAIHYQQRHDYAAAIRDHEEAHNRNPKHPQTANYLAWILATCPEAALRDGERAVELATVACEATEWEETYCLDTLACAYAECGEYSKAVRTEQRVVELADESMKEEYEERLRLFEEGKPYRAE